ncbi:uncharacterized protein LOC125074518 [Vanessa atalanta]|uniref:uncharacterized protein LOC125074518 n=1 Tax=Vanessa atalanta TaxID=42275 RepID=UPI001FCDEA12|nr:uncharacterized protein LOC125074518 [Vanessa atalanta]
MSFLRVVLKPRQTEGNIISQDMNASDNDNTQLPESASILEEIPQKMSIDNNLQQDPPPSPSLPGPSPLFSLPVPSSSSSLPAITRQTRKRKGISLEAFLDIEREKMKILREDQPDNTDDDLLWFKSILPYMKQLPSLNKLHFRTQMQEFLLRELSKLNPPHSSAQQNGYYTSFCQFGIPDDGSEDRFESDEAEEFNVNTIQRLLESDDVSSNLLQNSPAHLISTPNNSSESGTSTIALCSQLDNLQPEEPLIVQSSSPLEQELTDESDCEDESWGKDFWTSRPDLDEFDKAKQYKEQKRV